MCTAPHHKASNINQLRQTPTLRHLLFLGQSLKTYACRIITVSSFKAPVLFPLGELHSTPELSAFPRVVLWVLKPHRHTHKLLIFQPLFTRWRLLRNADSNPRSGWEISGKPSVQESLSTRLVMTLKTQRHLEPRMLQRLQHGGWVEHKRGLTQLKPTF